MAYKTSRGRTHQIESALALTAIAFVIVAGLRFGNDDWHHILLVAVFIPTIVVAVRHGQKPHYEAHRALQHQATHDALTGLPNRALFQECLQASMQSMSVRYGRFAVAMLDLDGFKAVNDHYGHLAGDALLQAVAERLRNNVRAGDMVARFGGDEFVLILDGVTDTAVLLERCNKLRDVLAKPYRLEGRDSDIFAQVSASIGIVLGGDQAAEQLIRAADKALYQAKAADKNCCVLTGASTRSEITKISSPSATEEFIG